MSAPIFIRLLSGSAQDMDAEPNYRFDCAHEESGQLSTLENCILEDLRRVFEARSGNDGGILIVPAEDVLLITVKIPTTQRRKIQQAIPFMVEEMLLDNVEDMHLAILGYGESGTVRVAVVSHRKMREWMSLLETIGFGPCAIVPESLLLPALSNQLTILVDSTGKILARVNEDVSFAATQTSLPTLLRAIPEADKKKPISLLGKEGSPQEKVAKIIGEELPGSSGIECGLLTQPVMGVLVSEYSASTESLPSKNLVQGGYGEAVARWRAKDFIIPFTKVACLVLAAQVLLNFVSGYLWTSKSIALEEETTTLYRELFPEDTRIVNIRTQLNAHLAALQSTSAGAGGADFYSLLLGLSERLEESMSIQSIRYNRQSEIMSIELEAATYAQLDNLQVLLSQGGMNAEISSATQDGEMTSAQMRISHRVEL